MTDSNSGKLGSFPDEVDISHYCTSFLVMPRQEQLFYDRAAATQTWAREPNIPTEDFMPDALHVATVPITGAWDGPTVCWIAHCGAL